MILIHANAKFVNVNKTNQIILLWFFGIMYFNYEKCLEIIILPGSLVVVSCVFNLGLEFVAYLRLLVPQIDELLQI